MASRLNSDLVIEFKRSVIHKIKEYPVIWNLKSRLQGVWKTDTRAAWDDVQTAVDFPLKKLKLLWASFRRHYFDILMNKTINRDDTFPKWKLFHDMSFMYETMKKAISEKMGGMSPPLFKPLRFVFNGAPRMACPCCLPITTEYVSNSSEISVEAESRKTSPIEIYDLSDPEEFNEDWTTNSFEGQHSDESLCESNSPSKLIDTISLQSPLNESTSNRSNQISVVNETLPENGLYQFIDTNSLQTLLPESSIDQSEQTVLLQEQQQLSDNSFSQLIQSNFLQEQLSELSESSINQSNQTSFSQEPLSENSLSQLIQSNFLHEPLSRSNANQFNQPIFFQEPPPENNQSNETNILKRPVAEYTPIRSNQTVFCQRKYTKRKPKAYIPREELAVEREKIINAIKPYPILYAKMPYKKGTLSQTWKNVAAEVGLQVHTVTNRWRLIKQRYVEEMMRERYSDEPFRSNWDNFEQMSFMREYLKDDVDDIDRIRQEMQTLVKEKKSRYTIDLCSDADDDVQYVVLNNASVNKSTVRRSKKQKSIDASQVDQSVRCDQPVISKVQPEVIQISNVTTVILSRKEFENSNSPDTDKGLVNSYQQAFERSVTSNRLPSINDDNQCEQPIKDVQPNLAKRKENKKSDVQVIELDLSSDEEDNVISVDDDDSVAAESEVEMYAEISSEYICPSPEYATISSVYISPSPVNVPTTSTAANITDPNNTICLDDDD